MIRDSKGYRGFDREGAESLALRALAFLAARPEDLERFLGITGLGPDTLRQAAAEPAFLPAVLDHFLAHEPLLLAFSAETGLAPDALPEARLTLGRG